MSTADWKDEIHLQPIIEGEVEVINRRRAALNQIDATLKRETLKVSQTGPNAPVLDVTGLALSGGGIRSASFAMGVLQALNEHKVLHRVDYLSTVSGGGYMGSALSATMTKSEQGEFVFGESTKRRASSETTDVKDTPAVGQVRNYSNYLIPFGMRDLVTALAIVFRGLVANISLVLPVILFFAAITIFCNPYRSDLVQPNFFGIPLDFLKATNFGITLFIALLAFPIFLIWAIFRSRTSFDKQSEFRTRWPTFFATYLIVVAAAFFVELQPFLIDGMFALTDGARAADGDRTSLLTAFVTRLTAIATSIAAVVTIFRQQLVALFKSVTTDSGITTKMAAYGAQAAIWIAGAAVPLLIWVAYLYLCYWGIVNNAPQAAIEKPRPPEIQGTVQIKGPGIDLHGQVDCTPTAQNPCAPLAAPSRSPASATTQTGARTVNPDVEHTPRWLINFAGVTANILGNVLPLQSMKDSFIAKWIPARSYERIIIWFYLIVAIVLFAFSWLLTPNANSLHRLYRDRLSKAFLFDPSLAKRGAAKGSKATEGVDLGRDFQPLDTMRISELAPENPYAPYHLINAALNIQGSDYANRRGRNADFFLFSPLYVGSAATNYASTKDMEKQTGLDLATAMAISGAAFSSNMGANSIRALTPTLALLNVRTGYWLKNPLSIKPSVGPEDKGVKRRLGSPFYLWSEITGRLYEDSPDVYLTDGGHIDNLGIYELLRRRCKVIVVVDAEADPAMRMPSFIALQRYARIDLGVRINMPWDAIRRTTKCWMGYDGKDGGAQKCTSGPHAAIGTIDYDGGQAGWLLYIKSSLSGDENDYVRDYARRYDQFPHESTGDQFFSEEQFEVYRALGFHVAYRLLSDIDDICVSDRSGTARTCKFNEQDDNVKAVRAALLGP